MFEDDVLYGAKQLRSLIGYKIVDTVITEDHESYGFIVEKKMDHSTGKFRKVCWVDCDPEGNGPGWVHITKDQGDSL